MISRKFNTSIKATKDPATMASNYDKMINKVIKMLNQEGPIYTTWIRLQIGDTNPLVFDSTSDDAKQNLITTLSVDKSGTGVANDFTINIKYDPFNYGQTTVVDKIEILDDMVAKAMSFDINSNLKSMRGYIQYGYNKIDDLGLVSPKYQFFLTNATSNTDWKTGTTDYTFEGVSELCIDCDFTTTIPEFKDANLLDIVTTVLWSYYGKESWTSNHIITREYFVKNEYNYNIEISDDLYKQAPTVSEESVSDIGPFTYCKNLLSSYMNDADSKNEDYKDLTKVKESQRPRYYIYLNDYASKKSIVVNYITPKNTSGNTKLNFIFSWGTGNNTNIVENWNPQVDLYFYLIQKAKSLRTQKLLDIDQGKAKELAQEINNVGENLQNFADKASKGTFEFGNAWWQNAIEFVLNNSGYTKVAGAVAQVLAKSSSKIDAAQIQAVFDKVQTSASNIPLEMYDAELTTVGIPADIPIACEVKVIPRQLETTSRTQGVYMVKSCVDNISNTGVFNSTLKLLRIRDLK